MQIQPRYIICCELLGYSTVTAHVTPNAVYQIADYSKMLLGGQVEKYFPGLCVGNSILFHRVEYDGGRIPFLDVYALALTLHHEMVSTLQPVRIAISHGDFGFQAGGEMSSAMVWGAGVTEAVAYLRRTSLLGVTMCPSATRELAATSPETLKIFSTGRFGMIREDQRVLLNPFSGLGAMYSQRKLYSRGFAKVDREQHSELQAFRFIYERASSYAAAGDFNSRIATKYHATLSYVRHVLGRDCEEWVLHRLPTIPEEPYEEDDDEEIWP